MSALPLTSLPVVGTPAVPQSASQPIVTDHELLVDRAAAQADAWVMKVSENQHEREAAFQLLHQVYFRAGLTPDNPFGMRVMRHHLLGQTDVLVAKRDSAIMSTSTLVRDAEYGLPLDSLFASEVDAMRAEGLRVAEISCLASDVSLQNKSQRFELLVNLISLTFQAARRRGVDRVLLAVHPRHARIYQRLFGCVPCSGVKEYAAVEGKPAVLCMHDFAQSDEARYPLYEQIYGCKYAPWQLDGAHMTQAEKSYFSQCISSKTPDMILVGA